MPFRQSRDRRLDMSIHTQHLERASVKPMHLSRLPMPMQWPQRG
jgi:hypothetical protein